MPADSRYPTDDETGKVYGERFAVVPEWVLDSDISDRAFRLYAVLARHADTDGRSFPGRRRLAERLRCSVDSLDRAMNELVTLGAVVKRHRRRDDGSMTSNDYWIRHNAGQGPTPVGQGAAAPRPHTSAVAAGMNESQITRTSEREKTPSPPSEPSVGALLELVPPPSEPSFEDFWRAYPRRVARGAAEKAWTKATKMERPSVIVTAAEQYRDDTTRKPEFTAHPATWLNGKRWLDEIESKGFVCADGAVECGVTLW